MEYETVLLDDDGSVGTVTLNRPDRMNAYTYRLGIDLANAIVELDAREEIRAIVVTGAGSAFCAGADLETGADTFSPERQQAERQFRAGPAEQRPPRPAREPYELNTPIIAAINGAAVGVGLTLTMQWDIRIAAEDAKLGFVFSRRGVLPELGSQWIVPRLVGVSRGLELLLTGTIITGREAAAIGLVSKAVPAPDVLPAALDLANAIAVNVAPASAAIIKRNVYRSLEEPDRRAARARESALFAWTARQPDAREGPLAFLEKRDP